MKKAERIGINIKSNGEIQIGKRRNEDNSNKKVNNRKKRKKINNFIYSMLVSVSENFFHQENNIIFKICNSS